MGKQKDITTMKNRRMIIDPLSESSTMSLADEALLKVLGGSGEETEEDDSNDPVDPYYHIIFKYSPARG